MSNKQSKFEVFDTATRLRDSLTEYIIHDFAVENFGELTSTEIWFLEYLREHVINNVADLVSNITVANTVYVTSMEEYVERRKYQTLAVANCYQLVQNLQWVIDIFKGHINVEKYMTSMDCVNLEIKLLKGWRKSENKIKKKFLPKSEKTQEV